MSDTSFPPVPGRLVTTAVLLLAATTIMSNATIAPSLPGIKAHFAATPGIETLAPLLLSLPSISIVLTAGLFGWLADRMSRQPLLLVAGLLAMIGGTSGLWADTMTMLLIGRVVLGIGVGGTMTLAMTWGADLWQGPARARYMGLQGAAMSAGGVLVLILGGALAQLGWRGSFAVYLVILPITLLAVAALAPASRAMEAERTSRPKGNTASDEVFPWRTFAFTGWCRLMWSPVSVPDRSRPVKSPS